MLDALVKHAQDEAFSLLLPPTGFYNYSQPIRWVVQISENSARLEEAQVSLPRPYTGRAGRNFAPHPFADEASYSLGVNIVDEEKVDSDAGAKHSAFLELMDEIARSGVISESLKRSLAMIRRCIDENWLAKDSRLDAIRSKDWVAFAVADEQGRFHRLFEHSEAKDIWVTVAKDRTAVRDKVGKIVAGECAVCGQVRPLISRIPVGVKLISKPGPLHSLNSNAFVSGRTDIKGHTNLCYECADTASRVFNALASSKENRRIIVMDKSGKQVKLDTLRNQVALFWVERGQASFPEADFDVGSALGDLMRPVVAADDDTDSDAEEQPKVKVKKAKGADTLALPRPEARLSQLASLLNVQREAGAHVTALDDGKFALAVFSPNVGRTALREWLYMDLGQLLPRVRAYLNATTINDSWGKSGEPQHINALMEALGSKNANLTRDLIRTAYQGAPPPLELLVGAVQRYRTLTVKGAQDKKVAEWERQRHLKTLAAALKFSLYYKQIEQDKGGQTFMTGLEKLENDPAYLCGRLLAVLEEAQQVYSYRQNKRRLKTTGVQRGFGAASTSPAGIFPKLVKLGTVAHLPKAGKYLNIEMETLVQALVTQGGM